jgi:hypothetical protein
VSSKTPTRSYNLNKKFRVAPLGDIAMLAQDFSSKAEALRFAQEILSVGNDVTINHIKEERK